LNWINLADLSLVHEQVIDATGGVHGIINPAALESALVRPFTSLGGEDMFPNLWSKLAALTILLLLSILLLTATSAPP